MFKQLQEPRRQKKPQELNDARQRNVMDHNKQSSGVQYGLISSGILVRDPSEMFMFGNLNLVQGLSNKLVFSESQNQVLQSTGLDGKTISSQQSSFKHNNEQTRTFSLSFTGDRFNACCSNQKHVRENQVKTEDFENRDNSSDLPSFQSGSWSSFMQTAVAEASSSDANKKYITSHQVSVKNEDGQRRSTFEAKQCHMTKGKGQRVASPTRKPNISMDASVRQNHSGMGSCKPQYAAKSSWLKNHKASKRNTSLVHKDVPKKNMVVLKSKKRKFPIFECLPWHKEVTEGYSRLHDMSTAELEWTHSANRLPEKSKKEVEKAADSIWMVHRKRRLSLTTQLMQLLFRPAPPNVLSEDANAHCDTVTYYAAKLALGDACSLASHSLPSGKNMTSKSISDQNLSTIVEGFIDRSERLEDVLVRLEKEKSSIVDAMMDYQELEKISITSRFAKFHTRRPLVTDDTATASSGVVCSMPKLYPQRYAKASPMPKTLPEGQHCLSL